MRSTKLIGKRERAREKEVSGGRTAGNWLRSPLRELVDALFALRAADELADARHQEIVGGHRFAVVVLAHVERLDVLGIIVHKHWAFEDLHEDEDVEMTDDGPRRSEEEKEPTSSAK